MQIPLTAFAAEFEQAARADEFITSCSDVEMMDAVCELFGYEGFRISYEYENELYSVFEEGRAPVGVLFH
jgi:hypothetical protein